MKTLLKILVGLVILVVLVLGAVWIWIDKIVETGIEKGGTYALKAETTVGGVSLSLLGGTLTIDDLVIANPEPNASLLGDAKPFTTPHLMKAGHFEIAVDRGSVLGDTVRVEKFIIDGLDIHIEQRLSGSNVKVIMKNLERFGSGGGPADEGDKTDDDKGDGGGGKKVQVDRIVIKNVQAHVTLFSALGKGGTLDIVLDEDIELEGVTSDNAAGVAVPALVARIVPAIMMAVVKAGGGVIPEGLSKDLTGDIAGAVGALGEGATNLLGQTAEGLGESLGGLGKGLEGLLKKKKDAGDTGGADTPSDEEAGQKKDAFGEGLKKLFEKRKQEN